MPQRPSAQRLNTLRTFALIAVGLAVANLVWAIIGGTVAQTLWGIAGALLSLVLLGAVTGMVKRAEIESGEPRG